MSARQDIADLMRSSKEWRQFFRACCERGHFRLRSQARQWRDTLRDRGQEHTLEDAEDALWELARDLLPNTSAAAWDTEWAGELAKKALDYLAKRYVEEADLSGLGWWDDEIVAAGVAEDRARYRVAVRSYVRAGLRAFDLARKETA